MPNKHDSSKLDGKDPETGKFLPGNRFWEARSSAGIKPLFDDPDKLWEACVEYFEWVDANPLWEDHIVTYQGVAKHEPIARMRAMTNAGLCIFLGIGTSTWALWRDTRDELKEVVERVEEIIRTQKFAGAAADLLNANIIGRDLGLADKKNLTGAIEVTKIERHIVDPRDTDG